MSDKKKPASSVTVTRLVVRKPGIDDQPPLSNYDDYFDPGRSSECIGGEPCDLPFGLVPGRPGEDVPALRYVPGPRWRSTA